MGWFIYVPVGHSAGVPVRVDVNFADRHDLLSAAVNVEVMFAKNHTPRPGAMKYRFSNKCLDIS